MMKNTMKRTLILAAAAAVFAFGNPMPTQAASVNTTVTYYTITWNGYQFKVPVYTTQPGQTGSVPQIKPPVNKPAPAPTPAPKQPTTPSQTVSSEVQQVVNLVNAERAKAGLPAVKLNTALSKMAAVKAQDMRDNNYFDHNSPTYGSPFNMMSKFGIKYSYAGENIAAGQKTPADVMKAWMNSPGHKANILSKNFTEIGIGVAKGGSYGTYWVQEFIKP